MGLDSSILRGALQWAGSECLGQVSHISSARLTLYDSYAMQWLVVIPLEMIAALKTISFWNSLQIPHSAVITIFLVSVFGINLCGVRAFGEAEFVASLIKGAAVLGFV